MALAALFQGSERGGQVSRRKDIAVLKNVSQRDTREHPLLAAECAAADPGLVLDRAVGDARGPAEAEVKKCRLRNRDETRLNQHLLYRAVELGDDFLEQFKLRRRAGGHDQVALVIDHELALEEFFDCLLDGGILRLAVVDELFVRRSFLRDTWAFRRRGGD